MSHIEEMDKLFKRNLPDSLYFNHYELADMYGFGPEEWRKYLRDNSTLIEAEIAAMVEPAARKAINRLGNASRDEVQALKALLEKSKLINDNQKQQTKIVMTFVPPADYSLRTKQEEPSE
jgi:hypothetical protein